MKLDLCQCQGCTNVGRTGWHIDGSFQEAPFSHSLYHIVNVPRDSATVFAPLTDIIENISDEKRYRQHTNANFLLTKT